MSNFLLNTSNITNLHNGNNVLRYNFIERQKFDATDEIAITHINMYFSWFNIHPNYNNTSLVYQFWDMNGDLQNFTVEFTPGYYNLTSIYEKIISVMLKNGHYLEDMEGGQYFLFKLRNNDVMYTTEFIFYSVSELSDSIKADFKTPVTWTLPSTYECISFVFPTNNEFHKLLGFDQGVSVTPSTVSQVISEEYTIGSTVCPQIEPSSSFIISCNLCSNKLALDSNQITAFAIPNIDFGETISVDINPVYSKMGVGEYDYIELHIYDQLYRPVHIFDPSMLINISIK